MSKGPIGNVHSVDGSQVSVGLVGGQPGGLYEAGITVGKFVKIQNGKAPIVGVIAEVSIQAPLRIREQDFQGTARVDLMGEIDGRDGGPICFRRGVTTYPTIGYPVEPLTYDEMRAIFDGSGSKSIKIGHLQQDSTIDVRVDINEMLSKHFAILGTTGVGKSSAVAVIL
jgi:uncharacterized protein